VRIRVEKVRARANRVGREVGFMTPFRRVETGFVTAHDCRESHGTSRVPFWDEMRNQHRQPTVRAILPCQAEKNVTIISKAATRLGMPVCAAWDGERTMRKWLVPLAVLGAGGLGAFFLSEKGRETLKRWLAALDQSPGSWEEWNEAAQSELDRIQATLNQIAQSLEPHGEPGR